MGRIDSKRRLSVGAVVSGAVLALGGLALFTIVVLLVLLILGMEPSTIKSGDFSLIMTVGLTFTSILAIFVAYVWGGYVSAKLAGGGIGHGIATAFVTLFFGFLLWSILVLSRVPQRLGVPFTPATMRTALKEGIVPLIAIGAILALVAKVVAGAIGGVFAHRKSILLSEDRFQPEDDFLDVRTEPAQVESPETETR